MRDLRLVRNRLLAILVACAVAQPFASAVASPADLVAHPSVSALQVRLDADLADGRLDSHAVLEAALIVQGVDQPRQLAELRDRFERQCERIGGDCDDPTDPRQLFHHLHTVVLTGHYRERASRLTGAIDEGDYNCLSGTILFCAVCERHGIAAVPMSLPAHVFVRLPGVADVETTLPDGYDNARPSASRRGRRLSPEQLLAKVFYNRGLDLAQAGNFARAVEALEQAVRLDPQDCRAAENRLAVLNNWALALTAAGDHRQAVRRIVEGLDADPDHEQLRANDVYVHYQFVRHLCRQGQSERALHLLYDARRRRPNEPLFRDAQQMVDHWRAVFAVER